MSKEFHGFKENPAQLIETMFKAIAEHSINDFPLINQNVSVYATKFQLFEGQWVGNILTPWMLSTLILPGPDQIWPSRTLGERLGLAFPQGNMTFMVGETEQLGQYLSSSLMSPINKGLSQEQAVQLADDSLRILLSLPITDVDNPKDPGRRALFSIKRP